MENSILGIAQNVTAKKCGNRQCEKYLSKQNARVLVCVCGGGGHQKKGTMGLWGQGLEHDITGIAQNVTAEIGRNRKCDKHLSKQNARHLIAEGFHKKGNMGTGFGRGQIRNSEQLRHQKGGEIIRGISIDPTKTEGTYLVPPSLLCSNRGKHRVQTKWITTVQLKAQ